MRNPLPIVLIVLLGACGPDAPAPLPANALAFGVFGDGPYYQWEQGRFRRVLADVEASDVAWLIHVGDFLWYPCSERAFEARRDQLDALETAVVYTPGDNEWTDCHRDRPGRYEPLARLAALRRIFFAQPTRSLGRRPLTLETQAAVPGFEAFAENARWRRGGFVFATVHLVGSSNGLDPFPGRTEAHDREVARRTTAALAWLDAAFAVATTDSARGVVLATHAAMGEEGTLEGYAEFRPFLARLRHHVARFDGQVLLIHGDFHELRVDQPLLDENGRRYTNFTRIETMGSPDIGWVRVVLDTVAGELVRVEPRRMRGYW